MKSSTGHRSILQPYRATISLAQLWIAASDHLFNNGDKKIRQAKNQIIAHRILEGKLKQLGLYNAV